MSKKFKRENKKRAVKRDEVLESVLDSLELLVSLQIRSVAKRGDSYQLVISQYCPDKDVDEIIDTFKFHGLKFSVEKQ